MQVVILAAGRGKRMGELTNDVPKPTLLVKGRPILEYILSDLPEEIDEIILIVGYKGEIIKKHFGDNWQGKKIVYCEQRELDGTGGALAAAKGLVGERFLVLMGDDFYYRKDLEKLLAYDLALLVKEIKDNRRFGVVQVDERGNLKNITEFKDIKGKNIERHLVNTGAYALTREIFDYPLVKISENEFGLPQTLAQLVSKREIKVVEASFWHPNGHEDDLIKGEKIIDKYFNHLI